MKKFCLPGNIISTGRFAIRIPGPPGFQRREYLECHFKYQADALYVFDIGKLQLFKPDLLK